MTQQEIKPDYVSFEQATWLKNKGFNVKCQKYIYHGNTTTNKDQEGFDLNCNIQNGILVTVIPEQWQVIEWLLQNHEIWITVTSISQESWQWHITKPGDSLGKLYEEDFYTPQEAYLAAFDYIKENNLI